jgi:Spy/CpxP family protein refolding chaperone
MGSQDRDRRRAGQDDPRRIVQIAKRLDNLSEEQKAELNEIEQAAGRESRRARRDRDAAAQLAAGVKQQIIDILTDEQALKFDDMLKQSDRPGRERGNRPGREGRRGRGGDDNP